MPSLDVKTKFSPLSSRLPMLWHGGDYNPDQWPAEVLQDDVRKMKKAGVNMVSLGIFCWSQLEPKPGKYDWSWLDRAMDQLHEGGVYVALATPSAAHPRWMTKKHPDIMRANLQGQRSPHAHRMMFCPSSPVYRKEVQRIDRAIAQRYKNHPALAMWHISNEYHAGCACEVCRAKFRQFLKRRYGTLQTMNQQWWAAFWSQRFSDWDQVDPLPDGRHAFIGALQLDWQRFLSLQVCDFFQMEIDVLRSVTPDVPVTTNLMGDFPGLNYNAFADAMDLVTWDSYPWHYDSPDRTAYVHSMMRGLKSNKSWVLIEQTPSGTNWQEYSPLKPPGKLWLDSLQAIAHGSDGAMYFQWRRSRGGSEKMHGAIVEHANREDARVFQEASEQGRRLAKLSRAIVGTTAASARIGILWDQDNRWALEITHGPGKAKPVCETVTRHYRAFWNNHIPADVVRMDSDWSQYDLLIAPMLYMIRSGRFPLAGNASERIGQQDEAAKIKAWTKAGGTFVTTYLSGIVNENDLVDEGGYPGPLRDLLGIWAEELDVPAPGLMQENRLTWTAPVKGVMKKGYACSRYFDMVRLEGARALATYADHWYAGKPCVTVNDWGKGKAYYLASDFEDAFLSDFYLKLAGDRGIDPLLKPVPASGIEVAERIGSGRRLLFVLNHTNEPRRVALGKVKGVELLTDKRTGASLTLSGYGTAVIQCGGC